jgi:hypothetical protein
MSTSATQAKIVRVRIKEDDGLFLATSPDLRGLLVAETTMTALIAAIPTNIAGLYKACGLEVVVSRVEDGNSDYQPWVAMPAAIARQALEQHCSC